MKKFTILLSLLVALNVWAQDDNKKRPSWSQGMPERQVSIKPSDTLYKPANDSVNSTTGMSAMEKPNLPNMDVNLLTKPDLITEPVIIIEPEPVLVIEANPALPTSTNRKAAFDQYYSGESSTAEIQLNTVNPLIAEYQWKPIKTTPIEVPGSTAGNEQLMVSIQINPKGQVVAIEKADVNTSDLVIKSAEKSILKWRFEPPSELGITENISKTFTIEIEIDA